MNDRDTHAHEPTVGSTSTDESQSPARKPTGAEFDKYFGVSPRTGFPYVKSRPGAPMVTTEEIHDMLKDFP